MQISEIRSKVFDFFRKRNLPVPEKWSDDAVRCFYERERDIRSGRARFYTRGAQLRALGKAPESAAPTITAPAIESTVSKDEMEQLRRRAIAALA